MSAVSSRTATHTDVYLHSVAICPDSKCIFSARCVILTYEAESMKEQSVESWNQEGSLQDMLDTFAEFPQWVKTTLSRTETVGLWQLRDQVSYALSYTSGVSYLQNLGRIHFQLGMT